MAQAPALTFHWNPRTNTVTIPSDNGNGRTETLTLRALFSRHALHYDAFAPSYERTRALALSAPATAPTAPTAVVTEGGGCPVCLEDDAPPQLLFRCGHALCSACTCTLAGSGGGAFACPLCRAAVTEVADVVGGEVNLGGSAYVVRYSEEVMGALVWRAVGGWVVELLPTGEVVVGRAGGEVRVHGVVGGKVLGMAVVTWVLVCVVKMVADGERLWGEEEVGL